MWYLHKKKKKKIRLYDSPSNTDSHGSLGSVGASLSWINAIVTNEKQQLSSQGSG